MANKNKEIRRGGMPPSQRAKQFMPFAALTGLQEALAKKERELGLVDKPVLSEETSEEIDRMLAGLSEGDEISVTYYRGGEIVTAAGPYAGSDEVMHTVTVGDTEIVAENILKVYNRNRYDRDT